MKITVAMDFLLTNTRIIPLQMLAHILVVASVALSAVNAANFGYWGYNK